VPPAGGGSRAAAPTAPSGCQDPRTLERGPLEYQQANACRTAKHKARGRGPEGGSTCGTPGSDVDGRLEDGTVTRHGVLHLSQFPGIR